MLASCDDYTESTREVLWEPVLDQVFPIVVVFFQMVNILDENEHLLVENNTLFEPFVGHFHNLSQFFAQKVLLNRDLTIEVEHFL
jgi:hypothetical protein